MAEKPEAKKSVKVFELINPELTNEEIATALSRNNGDNIQVIVGANAPGIFYESGLDDWVGTKVDKTHFTVSLRYPSLHEAAKTIATCVGES